MNHNETQLERATAASGGALLPVSPRVAIAVRQGTLADVAFIDALQKKQSKQVGFFPTKAIEGKVRAGHVLIAERVTSHSSLVTGHLSLASDQGPVTSDSSPASDQGPVTNDSAPVGYLIGNDQYFKRDDVGIIYQINVVPAYRRSLVAATLLKAQFERSAYGCKLYCCWCAQDIEANRFWESMGFVPLAFRTGGRGKKVRNAECGVRNEKPIPHSELRIPNSARVHIFWQKRIRSGDVTTPWWFPSKTAGGAINEDRIVLPIPPGVGWRDAMPVVLPETSGEDEEGRTGKKHGRAARGTKVVAAPVPAAKRARVQFGPPGMEPIEPVAAAAVTEQVAEPVMAALPTIVARPRRKAKKADPAMVAAARELRDRWLDEVNAGRVLPAMPIGKYEVTRLPASPVAARPSLAA